MVLRQQHAVSPLLVAIVLVAINPVPVPVPVLSWPAPAPAPSTPIEQVSGSKSDAGGEAGVDLTAAELRESLEKAIITSDVGPPKKPTKRSQAAAASISQSVFAAPASTAETVSLSPQIPDPDKKGSAIQGLLLNILHPKPIVDTIREEDKYGNTGDKFAVIGRGVVAGAEGVSQVLLKVLDFPFDAVKKVSRSATEALNNLGSKLIGLS